MDVPVNYLAVLAAAIASMVVGALWYGFLFRKKWMQLMGGMGGGDMTPTRAYAIQFVVSLIMAYVLSHLISFSSAYMETGGVMVGLSTGFWVWLGIVVPISLGSVLWEGRVWKLWFINASQYLVTMLAMGSILAFWR